MSTIIAAIAACASGLAAIVNLAIAASLARIARRNGISGVFAWAADLLSNDEIVSARRDLFRDLSAYRETGGTYEDMGAELKGKFERVCRTFDLVGIAGHNGMLPRNIIAAEWGNSIVRLHELCEPYLEEIRRVRGPDFWNNFSQLYSESLRIWSPRA